MATIKSYTDIEQSRKLAEILPLESADMWYQYVGFSIKDGSERPLYFPMDIRDHESDEDIPCWSLAALLYVASTYCYRLEITLRTNKKYNVFALKNDFVFRSFDEFPDGIDNLIDCCYEMILMLRKLNLL